MLTGLGTDVIEVARMARELDREGGGFRDQVFTPAEIAYCESQRYPARHFAARFAAKEALLKALGTGLRDGISWHDVEVQRDALGRPTLALSGEARAVARQRRVASVLVSLAHTASFATASVVLEAEDGGQGARHE